MSERLRMVYTMEHWIGFSEFNKKHRKIIDLYNRQSPLPRGYKMNYTDSWCAATVTAAAFKCNLTDIFPCECSVSKMVELAKEKKIWVESDSYNPKPGDLIVYDWQDSGLGDNHGTPDHVGLVEYNTGSKMGILEGNYKDSVRRRIVRVGQRYIRGYITPKYKD